MENKHVGMMIIGIALLLLFVIFSYDSALEKIVNTSCTHGPTCPMYATIDTQKVISYSLLVLLLIGGLYVMFFMKENKP